MIIAKFYNESIHHFIKFTFSHCLVNIIFFITFYNLMKEIAKKLQQTFAITILVNIYKIFITYTTLWK